MPNKSAVDPAEHATIIAALYGVQEAKEIAALNLSGPCLKPEEILYWRNVAWSIELIAAIAECGRTPEREWN